MKVLYVVGSCLTKNTSANMSHNAFIQGLLENGCEVDILMAQNSWGQDDTMLPRWQQAHYICYPTLSFFDKIRNWVRKIISPSELNHTNTIYPSQPVPSKSYNIKLKLRSTMKKGYYLLFPSDPCYPLERIWLKKAAHFQSNIIYDLIVSESSPASSHKLVDLLRSSNHLHYKRWIQIWEDPWYQDLYGNKSNKIFEEEHQLLLVATEVYYVSPLTLEYQKELFPDCAYKMKHIPLPYLDLEKRNLQTNVVNFGYFGDYYSHTRNLLPFYQALDESGLPGSIYGDSDLCLKPTEKITVRPRVTLDILSKIQSETQVLVHLCNLHGGQIPGKIYHYSATNKPILFILDGTTEEKQKLKNYFGQFNRYYFVDNQKEQIYNALIDLSQTAQNYVGTKIEAFAPKNVVKTILAYK